MRATGKRWVVEGRWSGYTSSQSNCCYRQIFNEDKARAIELMHRVVFSDGTCLYLSARPANFRERVEEKKGYQGLVLEALEKRRNATFYEHHPEDF